MAFWTDRVVPRITDRALSTAEVMELRAVACAGLAGRVLEIGFGSGLNVGLYPDRVSRLDAVEPSELGWSLSARRRAGSPVPIERTGLDGQRLSAADGQYDAVLSTFTLCTIPDVARALSEVRRVLAPGGAFHFLEHGLAPESGVARWQRRLDPVQRRVCGGCHLSRDIPGLVGAAGLDVVEVAAAYLPGPRIGRPWAHGFVGRAVRSG
jgi:SAM-dependent methyltransferase